MKFTDRLLKNLKPSSKRSILWEEASHGLGNLGIRISPTGRKSWIFMYRFAGKPRMLTLGAYPKISVAQAHTAYGTALEKLQHGNDPGKQAVEQRQNDRKALTIAQLTDEYLEKWAKPRKRSWKSDEQSLRLNILPIWGDRKAKSIKRRDIIDQLDTVLERGAPVQANRVLALVRKMFNFAISRDLLDTSPCTVIAAPTIEKQRDRMLSASELQMFLKQLPASRMIKLTRLALQFQLLTAQRCGEVTNAAWSEIDLEDKNWTIPSEKAKNKLSHRVPISDQGIAVLKEVRGLGLNSKYVFPAPSQDLPMTVRAVARAVRRNEAHFAIPHFTPHDLRRTAASHMTSIGISRLVVSKILNHVESGITAVYDRHSYDKEKREALDAWGRQLEPQLWMR